MQQGLALDLMPQLKAIARNRGLARVTYVEMIVGVLHGVKGAALERDLAQAFRGTGFDGADVEVTMVVQGERFQPPGRGDLQVANGWELLVARIEGERRRQAPDGSPG
jgi:hypothetical protein